MIRLFKFSIAVIIITCCISKSYSQLSVSYYDSPQPKIGLGYDFTERFWGELRVYGFTRHSDFTPELVGCYNVVDKERHNIYIGLGAIINLYNGIVLPIGVQITPIESFDRFSLHMEIQPTLSLNDDLYTFCSWGLRYRFKK